LEGWYVGVVGSGAFEGVSAGLGGLVALAVVAVGEVAGEFLGNPEHGGDGPGADYTIEPLRPLDAARASGGIHVYALGLALGALDLWAGLETVAVFDADVFDQLFANLVHVNDEGTVVRIGRNQPTVHVPFTQEVIEDLWASGRLAPETGYSLRRAWEHRDRLLGAA
jgi:hypothetical protein